MRRTGERVPVKTMLFLLRPVSSLGPSKDNSLHRVLVCKVTYVSAAILHTVDFVAVMKRLHG